MNKFAFLLIAAVCALQPAAAQPVRVDAVEIELVAERDAAVPGAMLALGLRIRHDPHWHTYWRHPGDSGLPTRVDLKLPADWRGGEIAWPAPKRIIIGPLGNYGFDGEVVLPIPVEVPTTAAGNVRLAARAQWLMCREVCVPGEAEVALELPVRGQAGPSRHAALFERAVAATPQARLPVRLSSAQGVVSLAFERPAAAAAEFFPYREGLVGAAAPQKLFRLDDPGAGRWRLELQAPVPAPDPQAWLAGAAGVVVIDGKAFEVEVAPAVDAAGGGALVATALGESAALGQGSGGGLSSLLSGAASQIGGGAGSGTQGEPSGATLALAALFAVLGGLMLNLMPCVFPVIGLKVLGFAAHADDDRAQRLRGALAFGAGVLVSFWMLAGLLLSLRAAGQVIGWGFQLQSPEFVAAMALLFVLMGLNFAGVFEIGTRLTQLGGLDPLHTARSRTTGAFWSGSLAVLVATPCTAPFMGSALGYTLGRPAGELLLVFGAIGVGMALPYVLLGVYPGALRWLPRPGRWMESFRQFLSFPMFATVAWLAWVLGQQAGIDAVLALALGAVLVALAAWLYGRFVQSASAVHRALAGLVAALAFVAGLWVAWPSGLEASAARAAGAGNATSAGLRSDPGGWETWSESRVAEAIHLGQPVFVEFTAAWCVSCQVNKKLVLEREPVAGEMARRKVVKLRADWTNRDSEITRALARHGRNGVPLYLVYLPGESGPRLLPEILTPGIVLGALAGR